MLKVIDLDKSFHDHQVLKHLNLEVKDGSIFGLVGVNGAGKSTLLRCIAGVYQPDHGEILLDEQNTYTNAKIRNQISFVSDEQYYPLGSTINSLKLLYESLYEFDENTFQKYLKIFELDPKMTIANLSKGMKRRVSILFALSTHPKLLLLDEAYDGLEPLARLHFKQALANMIEEEKVSVIISSHNLKELEDICDSFGILEDGQIVSYGDLLESKEQINKYQIVFQDDFDEEKLHDENLLHLEKEGRVYKLVIRGEQEEVLKKLNSYQPILVDMLPVNFEELFIYELESRGHKYE